MFTLNGITAELILWNLRCTIFLFIIILYGNETKSMRMRTGSLPWKKLLSEIPWLLLIGDNQGLAKFNYLKLLIILTV